MHHVVWNSDGPFNTAILIKRPALKQRELETYYLQDIGTDNVVGFSLDYGNKKKPTATIIKTYLETLLPAIDSLNITTLYCADGEYFKKLTKQSKAEPHLGYVLPCAIDGYEHMNVIYGVNYQSIVFDPKNRDKLKLSLSTLTDHLQGSYQAIGTNIIHSEVYPITYDQIKKWLESLHKYPVLTCDIETFSLKHHEAGLGSIGFAWDKHNGGAFAVDMVEGNRVDNIKVKLLLRDFFISYQGKLIYHNGGFDMKILCYELFMREIHK